MSRSQSQRRWHSMKRLGPLVATMSLTVVPSLLAKPPVAATGTIKGRLVYAGGDVPAPKFAVKAGDPNVRDPFCKTTDILDKDLVIDPATKGIGNAFAYLLKPKGDFTELEKALLEATPKVVIDQVGCEFVPYAAVVHKDQKLIFKSSDPVGHNVDVKKIGPGAINAMLPPKGEMSYAIKKADTRPTTVVCDIHPWMKAFFFVVDSPFAVVTKPDGTFEMTGVPAGEQQLIVWQSTKGYVTEGGNKGMKINVKAGEVTDLGDVKFTK